MTFFCLIKIVEKYKRSLTFYVRGTWHQILVWRTVYKGKVQPFPTQNAFSRKRGRRWQSLLRVIYINTTKTTPLPLSDLKTGLLTKFGAETPPTETPNTSFLRTTSVKRTLDIPQLFSFLPFTCNAVLILPAKQCLLFFFLSKFAELPNHNFINLISLLPTVTRAIFSCLLIPMNSYYL